MKVAHVIRQCSSSGAEMLAKELVIQLSKLGIDTELWVLSQMEDISPRDNTAAEFERSFIDEVKVAGVEVIQFYKKPRKNWLKIKRLIRDAYLERKPNVIHAHLESNAFHVCHALHKYRVPLVQTIHSIRVSYPILHRVYLGKRYAKYIAISKTIFSKIRQEAHISDRRIALIYNGVSLDKFVFRDRDCEKIRSIVAVGRFSLAKDYPNLLNAYSILVSLLEKEKTAIPGLSIVGDGDLRKDIESMIKSLNLEKHVELLGVRRDIPDILRQADIYVMSSEWEGLSIALIEALASGLPIVATDAGSNNEIVENGVNGLIVPTKNPQALAKGMYDLIANREMRESFSKTSAKSAETFSIETCAQKHMSLYRELMKNSKQP